MADFYIDPSLAVNGTGTELDPFNTLASIVLGAGNNYKIKRGTFQQFSSNFNISGTNGTAGAPIVFEDYGDAAQPKPRLIFVAGAFLNIATSRAYYTFRNLTVEAKELSTTGFFIGGGSNNLIFSRVDFYCPRTTSGGCINVQGAATLSISNILVDSCRFYSGTRGFSSLQTGATQVNPTGIYIRNCEFYNVNEAIRLSVETSGSALSSFNDLEISNCLFQEVVQGAIITRAINLANSDVTPPTFWGRKLRVFNNRFINCGLSVGNIQGTFGCSFWEDVVIYNNTLKKCSTGGALIQGTHRRNVYIYNNICDEAIPINAIDGSGIFADRFDNNIYIYQNTIRNNAGLAVTNGGEGVAVWMATNVYIYGNTIYNCVRGFSVGGNSTQASSNINIFNNTLVNIKAEAFRLDGDGVGLAADAVSAYNNLIINSPVGVEPGATPQTDFGNNWYVNVLVPYAGIQAAGAGDNTTSTQEELLITPEWNIKADSPLIGVGTFLGYFKDKKNRQFYNPPSIGAYEYERPRLPRS